MIQRRTLILTGASTLAAGLAGCASSTVTPYTGELAYSAPTAAGIVTDDALAAVNAFRRSRGRGPLRTDPTLGRAAQDHAIAMARQGRISHDRFSRRIRAAGITTGAAENVAAGQPDLAAALRAWENSRGHRANLLGDFSRLGVALARHPASGNRPYWAMILAG